MTRALSLPLTTLVLLVLTGQAAPVRADVPSPSNSTTPTLVRLVGSSANAPDAPAGSFIVVVRGLTNDPKNGASVVVDFSQCPDAAICADQLDPSALVNCAAKYVRKFTNAVGEVSFTLLGGSTGPGLAASTSPAVRIFGNGTLLRIATFAAFDLDGSGGVGAGDLSVWLSDFGSGVDWARSDYDGSGTVGASDLSEWLTVFGAGTSTQSCTTSCP
jgi:hypothetical protein